MYEINDQYVELLAKKAHRELKQHTTEGMACAYEAVLERLDIKNLQGHAAIHGAEDVYRVIKNKIFEEFKENL